MELFLGAGEEEGTTDPGEGTTDPGEGTTDPGEGTTDPGEGTTNPEKGPFCLLSSYQVLWCLMQTEIVLP
jgi:hypothetical protein